MLVRIEPRFAVTHSGRVHPPVQKFPSVPPFTLPEIFVDAEEEAVDLNATSGVFVSEGELGDGNAG